MKMRIIINSIYYSRSQDRPFDRLDSTELVEVRTGAFGYLVACLSSLSVEVPDESGQAPSSPSSQHKSWNFEFVVDIGLAL